MNTFLIALGLSPASVIIESVCAITREHVYTRADLMQNLSKKLNELATANTITT